MFRILFFAAAGMLLLAGCGYKGDLYLPKDNDTAQFGVIQTGFGMQPVDTGNLPRHD